jgi:acid phosphatase type 7
MFANSSPLIRRTHAGLTALLFCVAGAIGQSSGQTSKTASQPSPQARPDTNPTFVFRQFEANQPIRLIAYGDMRFTDPARTEGTNPRVRRWLAEKIGEENPQALMVTGDMPYTGDKQADWDWYQKETASWKADGFPVFPTMGNHEIYYDKELGIANFLKNYPDLKGHLYYSALLGSVEVLSLNMTAPVGPHSDQGRWFAAQLEHLPAQVEFLFILYHIPWVADTQSQLVASLPGKDALMLRGVLEAHLPRMHAKVVVFNGHIHNYERFERHGAEYVVTGGGGAIPYPILYRGTHDLYRDLGFPVYHYLTLEVKDHQLKAVMLKVINPDAASLDVEPKDTFVIKANPVPPSRSAKK